MFNERTISVNTYEEAVTEMMTGDKVAIYMDPNTLNDYIGDMCAVSTIEQFRQTEPFAFMMQKNFQYTKLFNYQ